MSYLDRTGEDPEQGSAIDVRATRGEVLIELGVMRGFGSLSADAWASLTPDEADEFADDLRRYARQARLLSPEHVNPHAKEAGR